MEKTFFSVDERSCAIPMERVAVECGRADGLISRVVRVAVLPGRYGADAGQGALDVGVAEIGEALASQLTSREGG
jgi:hypothetical protein